MSCPIVREFVDKPMKRAWLTVFNETNEDVTCEIEAFRQDGSFLEESSLFLFLPNPGGSPVTAFTSNDEDDDDSGGFDNSLEFVPKKSNPRGYYIFVCYLPRMSIVTDGGPITMKAAYIVRYEIEEVEK